MPTWPRWIERKCEMKRRKLSRSATTVYPDTYSSVPWSTTVVWRPIPIERRARADLTPRQPCVVYVNGYRPPTDKRRSTTSTVRSAAQLLPPRE